MEDSPQAKTDHTMPVAWQHNKNLPDCMIELYDKNLWTDVRLHCKGQNEDKIIHAHRIVLAARSPVFQAMFFGPCADGKDEVELENTDQEILDLFLRYLYNDGVTLSGDNAASVLEMAHLYQVTSLVEYCADYLSTIITPENACETLALVMHYELTTLGDACCAFIDKHAEEVLNSDGFLQLSEGGLTYILKGDTFYANEDVIFKKAEEWAKRKLDVTEKIINGPNIRLTLGKSFYYLRLPAMTFKNFTECIRKKGYFTFEEYEDLSEHINKTSEPSVRSNSCVARVPTEASLRVNKEGTGTKMSDTITTRFHISVSREVKLTNIIVSDIQHFKKLQNNSHTILDKIEIVLSGVLQVTCKNRNFAEEINSERKESTEYDKNKDMIFKQTFELKSSDLSQRKINLKEPVILTKTKSPYEIEMCIKYNSECGVKMNTSCNWQPCKTVRSENGELFIQDIEGKFAGIQSLGFENVSNREDAKE